MFFKCDSHSICVPDGHKVQFGEEMLGPLFSAYDKVKGKGSGQPAGVVISIYVVKFFGSLSFA